MSQPDHIGKYRVETLLGRGGFGEVFLCHHPELAAPRAIKLLFGGLAGADSLREGVLMARLNHENIVRLMDVGEQDGRPYLVMEYVAGGNLAQAMLRGLSRKTCLALAAQLARALDHAHGRGVVHRDLKPGNVLLTNSGSAKVTDFGLARLLKEGREHDTRVAGSVPYLAPEQLAGKVGPASDLWALGCLLYRMLAGRPPFEGDSDYQIMRAIESSQPPPLPDVPPELSSLVFSLLSKDPAGRPAPAAAVAERLAALNAKPQGGRRVTSTTMVADDWPGFLGGAARKSSRGVGVAPPLARVWDYQAGAPLLASPAVCRGRVFLAASDGSLHALDLLTGRPAWRADLAGPAYPSPAAVGTAVVAAGGRGEVTALAASDGSRLWQSELKAEICSSPLVTSGGVYLGDMSGRMHRLDPVDGRAVLLKQGPAPLEASALFDSGLLVWADRDGNLTAWDPVREEERWSRSLGVELEASPASASGRLFCLGLGGGLFCLDTLSGQVRWRRELGAFCPSAPAIDGMGLVVVAAEGRVMNLDPADGKVRWKAALPAPATCGAALGPGAALVADRGGSLSLLGRKDGRVLQILKLPGPVHATVAVWQELALVADMTGCVTAHGPGRAAANGPREEVAA